MDKSSAIKVMNRYGSRKIPFLFIIDFLMNDSVVLPVNRAAEQGIFFDIGGFRNIHRNYNASAGVKLVKRPVSLKKYSIAFNNVQKHINRGDTYLLNLTFPTKIEINLSLDEIFTLSGARYKLLYKNYFIVFSPEIFVRIKSGYISSYPMKGTIDSSVRNARKIIINDQKEIAEHTTIVDLIRNDLSIVAGNVGVEKFRYIEEIKTNDKDLLQVSSKITGKLDRLYRGSMGDIIFSLLPAGSISGAPKKNTVEIIRNVESYERGYYTGVCGYFDGTDLDSGVMIRFIENNEGVFNYKSGGGITAFSNMRSEYEEMIDKVYVPVAGND